MYVEMVSIFMIHCRLWLFAIRNIASGFVIKRSIAGRAWWRHQMETFSALMAICAGNSTVPVTFPHKGQWRGALMFSLICVWINGWVINNHEAGDLRRYRAHYDVIAMVKTISNSSLIMNHCHWPNKPRLMSYVQLILSPYSKSSHFFHDDSKHLTKM